MMDRLLSYELPLCEECGEEPATDVDGLCDRCGESYAWVSPKAQPKEQP